MQLGAYGEHTELIDNSATNGGALYLHDGSSIIWGASNTSAGATYSSSYDFIRNGCSPVDTILSNTSFINNTAETLGGAVYVDIDSRLCWVSDTMLEGNSAEREGALFIGDDSTVILQGTTVCSQTRAFVDGGAIAYTEGSFSGYSYLDFNGSTTFVGNIYGGNGGAMALFGNLVIYSRDGALTFLRNSAGLSGGAIFMSGATNGHTFEDASFRKTRHRYNFGCTLFSPFRLVTP